MNNPVKMPHIPQISREDYKRLKRMDRRQLTNHLLQVYMKGVERGRELERAEAIPPTAKEVAE